jgi:ANTAR domain/GAF domain
MRSPDEEPDTGHRDRLASRTFVALADTLTDDYDIIDFLDRLAAYSIDLLDADAAGIMLADSGGNLHVAAASSEDAQLVELLQVQTNEGPCMDSFRTSAPVGADDLVDAAARWPAFAAAAREGRFRAVHAFPLRLRREAIGALNLFYGRPHTLARADGALGQALADVATLGILSERAVRRAEVLNEQLQTALNSRVIIEQAKGVLAERGGLGMDAAFERLRNYSRRHGQRLSEVARQVVESGLASDVLRS